MTWHDLTASSTVEYRHKVTSIRFPSRAKNHVRLQWLGMTAHVQHYTPTATSILPRSFLPSYVSLSLSVTQSNSLFTLISLSRTHTHIICLSLRTFSQLWRTFVRPCLLTVCSSTLSGLSSSGYPGEEWHKWEKVTQMRRSDTDEKKWCDVMCRPRMRRETSNRVLSVTPLPLSYLILSYHRGHQSQQN